ncbi:MAG: hypothetical protein MAG453_02086 [Calditrichaeota bacterium]|nr:hypothetical protein [Calditrichota bacterium]
MMKRVSVLALAVILVFAFSAVAADSVDRASIDKEAYYAAVSAWETGTATQAQIHLLKSIGYDFSAGAGNEIDNMGGPDAFGYIWKDSEEADGPTYSWVDISGTGTDVSDQMNDDNYVGPFDIGFDFPFYGQTYSQFYIQSNGTISFFDDIVWYFNTGEMPNPDYGAMIAWFWDDLDPDNPDFGGDIGGWTYYETTTVDGQDALVIQFQDYEEWPQGEDVPQMTAQAILFADGTVKLQYNNVDAGWDVAGGTIGIQNDDGTVGLTALTGGSIPDYPYSQLAIQFYMADPDASASGYVYDSATEAPIEGANVNIGGGTATTDANGYYEVADLYSGTVNYEVSHPDYFTETGTLDVAPGANVFDFYLDFYSTEADILVWAGDPTPGNVEAVDQILNDLGYTTFYTTQYDEVNWADYEYVFAFLGIYSNYYPIYTGDPEETAMVDYMNQGGNLYIEGGDIFGFNSPDNLMAMLNLTDIADGSGDLANVMGYDGTWMEGADMAYAGENNWIDDINASNGATDLLYNPADMEGCGVVDNSMDYNTACFSFEVGALVDDGFTRADLLSGLFDFWAGGGEPDPIELTLIPLTGTIPAEGGTVEYDAEIMNNTGVMQTGQAWTMATMPDGSPYGPMLLTIVNLPAGMMTATGLTQNVPAFAPAGVYTFTGNLGAFGPGVIVATDSFEFEKMAAGAAGGGVGNWDASDWDLAGESSGTVQLPAEFELAQVYPNPFNPTANVRVSLPEASELTVQVFNVMGRQVAELVSGQVEAGMHNFVLDGSSLASGIYFIQANVPGELNAVQKVTLMK